MRAWNRCALIFRFKLDVTAAIFARHLVIYNAHIFPFALFFIGYSTLTQSCESSASTEVSGYFTVPRRSI